MNRFFTLFILLTISPFTPAQAQQVERIDTSKVVNIEDVLVLSSYAKRSIDKPMALSNVSAEMINTKISNQEFPEILKSTPSLYATKMGGGFGDSRLSLRGFGSDNVTIMLNGVPINGMENGAVYWSNWASLVDVADRVQVQRGIGLSRLGVFSAGGTVNIITTGAQNKRGAWVQHSMGNDGYQKTAFRLSSEQIKGWSLTLMGSYSRGDGYVLGTEFEAWSYFIGMNKRFNNRHSLTFTAFGAPQWHNRRPNKQTIEDYQMNENGIKMNTALGYHNGSVLTSYSGYNTYHKPQISINHLWYIGERASLTTSLYASIATGGGRKIFGNQDDANRIQYDYRTGKPIYGKDGKMVTNLTPDGLIDYDPLMNDNRNSASGSKAVFTMGTNSHNWYGLISNFQQPLGQRFTLSAGIDFRYYKGFHFDEIDNLLGGSHFIDNTLAWRAPNQKLHKGDRVGSDYYSEILWVGGYAQLEYNTPKLQAFLSASLTDHEYRRVDPGRYGEFGDQQKYPSSASKTPWRKFLPMSFKAGVNYRFTNEHRLFVNGGYITKAPVMANIYLDNNYVPNAVNEKVLTAEMGYNFNSRYMDVTLNGYVTSWKDKSTTKAIGAWNGPRSSIPNLDALHMGVELTVSYTPFDNLRLDGYFSYGNWRWMDDIDFTYVDERGQTIGQYKAYIDGLYVGNAPQTSAYLSANWKCLDGLQIGADVNYYARHYADFSAIDRTNAQDRAQSWKLPDYSTVDLNISYTLKFNKCMVQFFGNVNNLFNTEYISEAVDNVITPAKGELGHQSENALVWYGFGTTWTAGIKVSF